MLLFKTFIIALLLLKFHLMFFGLFLQWSRVQRCFLRPMEQDLVVQGMQQCIMIQCVSSRVIMAI